MRLTLFFVTIIAMRAAASAQVTASYNGGATIQLADSAGIPTSPPANLGLTSFTSTGISNSTACLVIVRVWCYSTSSAPRKIGEVGIPPFGKWNPGMAVPFSCDPGETIAISYEKVGVYPDTVVVL